MTTAEAGRSGSWWTTLPGMLTAAAGLISAITALVVAVQQLRPSHDGTARAQVSAPAATPSAPAQRAPAGTRAVAASVTFPAGRHAEANGGLSYDFLSARATAGNPGERNLALRVRLTNPGRYDANFWSGTFRLRVGPDTSAPTNSLDDLVHGGTTGVAEVDFTIAASVRRATLLVGDDPAHAVALPLTVEPRR